MVKILLVNPSVYDFAAYDFWVKPYGMLNAAGTLRDRAEISLFDYMDREDNLYYYMPDSMTKFAKSLNRKAQLRRNAPLHDYTLYIHKG